MDTKVVIGVAAVAVLGGGLAVLAVLGSGVPSTPQVEAPAPAAVTRPQTDRVGAPVDEPESDRREAARMANEAPDTTPRLARPRRPREGLALPPDYFDAVQVEHDRLMHQPAFLELPPDEDPAVIAQAVDEALEEVHALAETYWDLGRGPDNAARPESLHRAAMLYDHLADELPPPALSEPGAGSAWDEESRESMVQQLRGKAEGLRKAALE